MKTEKFTKILNAFSSPSGDGLVLEWYDRNKFVCEFSSPLGDGLVPQ